MKRIFAIFMAVLLCLPLAILPLSAAGSSEGSASTYDVKASSAFDDLATVFVDGVKKVFSTEDEAFSFFSKNSPGWISMVTLAEHGVAYGDLETTQKDYGLYIYVSSDLGSRFDSDTKPTITIATEFERRNANGVETSDVEQWLAMDYDEYTMTLVGEEPAASDGRGLYKFKVDIDIVNAAFLSAGDSRRYDIGALEFMCKDVYPGGEDTPSIIMYKQVSVPVGTSYVCTGYRDGYRNGYAGGNYRMTTTAKEVIEFDVQQAAFRYENNDSIDQITSVYFAVDNKYLEKYGYISAIKASWDERRTTPIVVTNDEALWNEYTDNGKISDEGLVEWGANSIIGFKSSLWDREIERSLHAFGSGSVGGAHAIPAVFSFNAKEGDAGRGGPNGEYFLVQNEIDTLSWFIPYCPGDEWGVSLEHAYIRSEELLQYRKMFANSFGDDSLLFCDDVGADRTLGKQTKIFYEKDFLDLKGFEYSPNGLFAKWFNLLLGAAAGMDDLSANVIQKVGAEEFEAIRSMTPEEASKAYFISEEEIYDFHYYCMKAIENDKTVVLLHFAKTDYFCKPVHVYTNGFLGRQRFDNLAYVAQENVFLDFDVIHIQFTDAKTNVDTVIPVSTNKTDIIPGTEPPEGIGGGGGGGGGGSRPDAGCNEDFGNTVKMLLGTIAVVVLFVLCWPVLVEVIKFAINLVKSFVSWLTSLFDDRRRRK